jgi:hypothetical protein
VGSVVAVASGGVPSSANATETFASTMLAIKRKENRILKKGCVLIMLSPDP